VIEAVVAVSALTDVFIDSSTPAIAVPTAKAA
jgi:hypothetical protein